MKLLEHFQNKSLMIFDDQIYYSDGHGYGSDEAHVLFMIGMKKYFQKLVFCSRLAPVKRSAGYTVPQEIELCPLPYYRNVVELCAKFIIYAPKIWRILREKADEWDILWLSWPHPVSLLMVIFISIRQRQKLLVLIVRQNLKQLVRLRYRGPRKLVSLAIVNFLEWQLKFWRPRRVVIFAVGAEMYQELHDSHQHVHLIALPPLSEKNIPAFRSLTCRAGEASLRLLFVGRLEPEKGLPFLVQCVAVLKEQNKNVHLDIVGSGVEEERLQTLVQNLSVSKEVSFHGYVAFGESLFSYYRAADFFVLPSLSEGIPNVLMEAMAFGIPIISTSVGGIAGVIRHKENGLLVEPGSATALAEAITELIDDPKLTADLGRRAKADSPAYSMEAQQEKILETLASLT